MLHYLMILVMAFNLQLTSSMLQRVLGAKRRQPAFRPQTSSIQQQADTRKMDIEHQQEQMRQADELARERRSREQLQQLQREQQMQG